MKITIKSMRMVNPPHPGDFIRTEIIEPHGLSVSQAAKALQVSRSALSHLLNEKSDLSGEMALRIEKAFGVKMDTLLRMQTSFDIARTRRREQELSSISARAGNVARLLAGRRVNRAARKEVKSM
ncbi:MAG: HigA family addiction module antidote protein [Acidobacteriaceae bacterium]|nr:HigA family addiction module antidote protein [Acidobacteriaceae bacterium]